MDALEKTCEVCGAKEKAEIETVTNVSPNRDEMFPVILCPPHKVMLAHGDLDIRMNEKGDLYFIIKRKPR